MKVVGLLILATAALVALLAVDTTGRTSEGAEAGGGDVPAIASSPPCDGGLPSNSTNPLDGAKVIGLCSVTSAAWVLPDGTAPGAGILTNYHKGHSIRSAFGSAIVPHEGNALLLLSTGTAADLGQTNPAYAETFEKGYGHGYPAGFATTTHRDGHPCPEPASVTRDGVGLQVTVQAPAGATGYSFDFDYHTRDSWEWACSPFVDYAAVMQDGAGNVLLDAGGDPITVNSDWIVVCESHAGGYGSGAVPTNYACVGPGELAGTGFDSTGGNLGAPPGSVIGAATSWRTITGSVTGGQTYTFTFSIWDTSDEIFDSTIVFDNFQWIIPDADGDTVPDASDNCPLWPNPSQSLPPWPVPASDPDCDGFNDADEASIGTDPADACRDNLSDDAWPPDFDRNGVVNILDVYQLLPPAFGSVAGSGNPNYTARKDIRPDGVINIFDIFLVLPPTFGSVCT